MVRVKICGITSVQDALFAVQAGAHALGFVMAPSPRQVEPETVYSIIRLLPPFVTMVAVLAAEPFKKARAKLEPSGCQCAQLHGDWPAETALELAPWPIIRALRMNRAEALAEIPAWPTAQAVLLDAHQPGKQGGTGHTFDWAWARRAKEFGKPIILAGGLTPNNVSQAIEEAQPDAVDVSTGVEVSPGVKDHELVRRFIEQVRCAAEALRQPQA